ncbi:programmed cell death protein 7-like [Centruroides vittatus]|uniref:programmed cell death protein 7-like n=1 Tax=Centruroides vittatus TaxID=120091 RepID=UPI00350F3182
MDSQQMQNQANFPKSNTCPPFGLQYQNSNVGTNQNYPANVPTPQFDVQKNFSYPPPPTPYQTTRSCLYNQSFPPFNRMPPPPPRNGPYPPSFPSVDVPPPRYPPVFPQPALPSVQQYVPPPNYANTANYPQPTSYQPYGNYYNALNVGVNANCQLGKTQEELDKEWIGQFLSVKGKQKFHPSKEVEIIIPEVQNLLHKIFALIARLSKIRDNLKAKSSNMEEDAWKSELKVAYGIMDKINLISDSLFQPKIIERLTHKMRKIKKKRERQRKQRETIKREKLEENNRRDELDRQIDCWIEREREKVLQEKREEELKKDADNILSEVRKKIHEAKRTQEKLKALEKLRQTRKDDAEKKAFHVRSELDETFKNEIATLREIVQKQLTDYNAEEKALKVMLETEQEGQREQEEMNRKERQEKLLNMMQNEILECLFGETNITDPSHPLWYFYQFYTQAESNLDALLQIRHQWDMYLVVSSDKNGSNIPVHWVTPDRPSNEVWASVLQTESGE